MKIFKIIIVNIIFILLVLVLFDYLIYRQVCHEYYTKYPPLKTKNYPFKNYSYFYTSDYTITTLQRLKNKNNLDYFRPFVEDNLNQPTKPPILIFGCSFAYGGPLDNNQTISYKLQAKTNRPVYNYAISGGGMQHMLYILQNPDFFKRVKDKPEYAIYIHIPDHQRRLIADSHPIETNGLYLKYNFTKNGLKLQKEILPSVLYRSFLVRKFLYNSYKYYFGNEDKYNSKKLLYENLILTNEILLECRRLLSEYYPNIKFIILKYSDNQPLSEYEYLWDILEKEGFIIIDTKDLIGRKFTVEDTTYDKFHPNEQAWDLVVPPLIEKLNL